MPLYCWTSKAMKFYAPGHILAIGSDIEDARSKARAQFEKVAGERWGWLFSKYAGYEIDEDETRMGDEKLKLFEADIMKEPEVSDAFFITGSE